MTSPSWFPSGRITFSGGLPSALLSAVLLILAMPPFGVFPLSFLALVPIALSLSRQPSGWRGSRAAAYLGGSFGLAYWGWSLIWVPIVVGSRFPWAFPGYLIQITLLGSLSALFAWLAHGLYKKAALPLGLALPLAWVGVEWVKAHFPLGLAFPWLGLGVSLAQRPELLGSAEWVGEAGVAFWLAGVSGLVAAALRAPSWWRRGDRWFLAVSVVLVPAVAGVVRGRTLPLGEGPRVLALGTQVSPAVREDPRRATELSLAQIREAIAGAPPGPWDLILIPEGAVALEMGSPEWEELVRPLRALAREVDAPLVVGTLGAGAGGPTNSAILISPGDPGMQRYDKVRLVPGMEAGAYVPGSGEQLFSAGGWTYGSLVCYESLYSGLARAARNSGAESLLNLTSDVWFGSDESLVGSLFLRQHPAHLVLRAVETRTSVARAANGGYSMVIDPLGEAISTPVPPGIGAVGGTLPVFSGITLFTWTGDWVGPGSLTLALLLLLLRRRRPEAPGEQLRSLVSWVP